MFLLLLLMCCLLFCLEVFDGDDDEEVFQTSLVAESFFLKLFIILFLFISKSFWAEFNKEDLDEELRPDFRMEFMLLHSAAGFLSSSCLSPARGSRSGSSVSPNKSVAVLEAFFSDFISLVNIILNLRNVSIGT